MHRIKQDWFRLKIREALRQVNRSALSRQTRHYGENSCPHSWETGVNREGGLHATVHMKIKEKSCAKKRRSATIIDKKA
jgi:hypothetical protein